MRFIDVATPMLGSDGQPRPELFGPDRLHMNRAGYALWRDIVAPHLDLQPRFLGQVVQHPLDIGGRDQRLTAHRHDLVTGGDWRAAVWGAISIVIAMCI